MGLKGLITPGLAAVHLGAPSTDPSTAGLQRVANRPIVCHALDRLHDAGVREVALLVPAELSAELQACLAAEAPADLTTQWFAYDHDAYPSALASAVASVGESPCIVHPPDGFLAQPLASFIELLSPDAPDLVVLVRESPREVDSIGLAPRRLLRLAKDGAGAGVGLDLSGICLFGHGALRRAEDRCKWRRLRPRSAGRTPRTAAPAPRRS